MHRILFVAAVLCAATSLPAFGAELGPGINPVACEDQPWSPRDPAFAALPGARVFFGTYSGGLYHVEIPEAWNG
ncbi:MAG: hypothetical protein RL328_2121, partial [Acidobacteriota bacterium]